MPQQHYTCKIVPLEGREFIQRNFAMLPQKAAKYSNRAVTLNERFAVIERGYLIVPNLRSKKLQFRKNVSLVPSNAAAAPMVQNQRKGVLKEQNEQKITNTQAAKEMKNKF